MSFGSMQADDDNAPLAEINMVPLIDVMLVLLVIFLVTAPLLTHAVKVDLPRASSAPNQARPDSIELVIDGAGQVSWNGQRVDAPAMRDHLAQAAAQAPQPEVHIRADRATPYENVARVMSAAARAGVARIGFVTEPVPQ